MPGSSLLLAQSRDVARADKCPLLAQTRHARSPPGMSAFGGEVDSLGYLSCQNFGMTIRYRAPKGK